MGVPQALHADPIDQAIAATEQPAAPKGKRLNLQISVEETGEVITLGVPMNVSKEALLATVGFITGGPLGQALAQAWLADQADKIEVVQTLPEGLQMPGGART